jgi:putative transposase
MEAASRRAYSSDLSDLQWNLIKPLLPAPKPGGRRREVDIREVVNAVFYVLKSGCAWKDLPHDFPPEGTVRDYFHQWRRGGVWERLQDALRRASRVQENREPDPSAGVLDSQSVKATRTTGTRGYDAGKKINGRKRHLLVDTLGLLVFVVVHVGSIQDRDGAKPVLQGAATKSTRLAKVWADGAYAGKLIDWTSRECGWELDIVKRSDQAQGFEVLPRRWVVERTLSWISNYRRLSKDYEYWESTSETMIQLAMTRVMLQRLEGLQLTPAAAAQLAA